MDPQASIRLFVGTRFNRFQARTGFQTLLNQPAIAGGGSAPVGITGFQSPNFVRGNVVCEYPLLGSHWSTSRILPTSVVR